MSQRHLSDLYTVGKLVKVDDGEGPVEVWVEKLRSFHAEKALRGANAKRAKTFAKLQDKESDEYLSLVSTAMDKEKDDIVSDLSLENLAKKYQATEMELEADKDERWSKDSYLQGLRDAWSDGLSAQFALDPEDEEAKRVFDEFQSFADEATSRFEKIRPQIEAEFNNKNLEELRKLWIEKQIEKEANEIWFLEYKKQEIFYAIRDPKKHKNFYFGSREDIDELAQEILMRLVSEYNALTVDVTEGKELQPTQPSSPSSDLPESPVTVEESGQQAALL